jgi:hypothetical protein
MTVHLLNILLILESFKVLVNKVGLKEYLPIAILMLLAVELGRPDGCGRDKNELIKLFYIG